MTVAPFLTSVSLPSIVSFGMIQAARRSGTLGVVEYPGSVTVQRLWSM
jgi:hypothetical protein